MVRTKSTPVRNYVRTSFVDPRPPSPATIRAYHAQKRRELKAMPYIRKFVRVAAMRHRLYKNFKGKQAVRRSRRAGKMYARRKFPGGIGRRIGRYL